MVFVLSQSTTADQERVNCWYFEKYAQEYRYIEQEVQQATSTYGIFCGEGTLEALTKQHIPSAHAQVRDVKAAFAKDRPVSLDTIVLARMIVYLLKEDGHHQYDYRFGSPPDWNFPLPKDVLKQLHYVEPTTPKARGLVLLLKEQIKLVNTNQLRWDGTAYTDREIRRGSFVRATLSEQIVEQLRAVRESLTQDARYEALASGLPGIAAKW